MAAPDRTSRKMFKSAKNRRLVYGEKAKERGRENVSPKFELEAYYETQWTPQQEAFVKYWAEGESVWAASQRAGYNDNGTFCYALARRPEVIAKYEKVKREFEEAAQMSRKKVMDGLLEAVEMAKLMAEPSTMVAGWREIGKMCGYYEPIRARVDVNLKGNLVLDRMNKLSDADLLKLIQEGMSASAEAAVAKAIEEEDEGNV